MMLSENTYFIKVNISQGHNDEYFHHTNRDLFGMEGNYAYCGDSRPINRPLLPIINTDDRPYCGSCEKIIYEMNREIKNPRKDVQVVYSFNL